MRNEKTKVSNLKNIVFLRLFLCVLRPSAHLRWRKVKMILYLIIKFQSFKSIFYFFGFFPSFSGTFPNQRKWSTGLCGAYDDIFIERIICKISNFLFGHNYKEKLPMTSNFDFFFYLFVILSRSRHR